MVLKTLTTDNIISIKGDALKSQHFLKIYLHLKLPQEIEKDKIAVVANGYTSTEFITSKADVETHSAIYPSDSQEMKIIYTFLAPNNSNNTNRNLTYNGFTSGGEVTLFFGILVTDE